MKHILDLIAVLLFVPSVFAAEYPNELEGFKLYAKFCSGLEPMKSTVADVKKVLGNPMEDKSGKFVLWFEKDGWQILVYIYPDNGEYPSHLAGKVVESIDFVSVKPVSFAAIKFPKAFNKAAYQHEEEYYDAYGLAYKVYTSSIAYAVGRHGTPTYRSRGDLNRVSYRAAPHQVIQMQQFMIREMKKDAAESKPKNAALTFDTYSGYFVSNKFKPDAAESSLVISDQEQFDKVFGVAFVMGDKSHRLPKDAFKSLMVVAAIKRGSAVVEYKVEGVTETKGVVELRYTTTEKKSDTATFACPLIVSIPKGQYKAIQFVENGKMTKKLDLGKDGGNKNTVQIRRIDKSKVDIQVTIEHQFPAAKAPVVLSIGQQTTNVSRFAKNKLNTLTFTMTAEDFAKTKDGDPIIVQYTPASQGQWDFGKLDKCKVEE